MKTRIPIYCFRTEIAKDVKIALQNFYESQEPSRRETYMVTRDNATVIVIQWDNDGEF